MNTIGERISFYIDSTEGMNRARFSEIVGISQAYVSQICSGVREPSGRVIADICRNLRISEIWLRTGNGEMIETLSDDQAIAEFAADILADQPDSFRKRLVSVLSTLNEDDWAVLAKIADELTNRKTDP